MSNSKFVSKNSTQKKQFVCSGFVSADGKIQNLVCTDANARSAPRLAPQSAPPPKSQPSKQQLTLAKVQNTRAIAKNGSNTGHNNGNGHDNACTFITQKDLDKIQGIVITKPGCYCLDEDLLFKPKLSSFAPPDQRAVQVAITIASSDVQLDFGCHTLKQFVPQDPSNQVPFVIGVLVPDLALPNSDINAVALQNITITGGRGEISQFSMYGLCIKGHISDVNVSGIDVTNCGHLASRALRGDNPTLVYGYEYLPHTSTLVTGFGPSFGVGGIVLGESGVYGQGPQFFEDIPLTYGDNNIDPDLVFPLAPDTEVPYWQTESIPRLSNVIFNDVNAYNNYLIGLKMSCTTGFSATNCHFDDTWTDDKGRETHGLASDEFGLAALGIVNGGTGYQSGDLILINQTGHNVTNSALMLVLGVDGVGAFQYGIIAGPGDGFSNFGFNNPLPSNLYVRNWFNLFTFGPAVGTGLVITATAVTSPNLPAGYGFTLNFAGIDFSGRDWYCEFQSILPKNNENVDMVNCTANRTTMRGDGTRANYRSFQDVLYGPFGMSDVNSYNGVYTNCSFEGTTQEISAQKQTTSISSYYGTAVFNQTFEGCNFNGVNGVCNVGGASVFGLISPYPEDEDLSGFRIRSSTNITFRNCSMDNGKSQGDLADPPIALTTPCIALELNGFDNVEVDNCTMRGWTTTSPLGFNNFIINGCVGILIWNGFGSSSNVRVTNCEISDWKNLAPPAGDLSSNLFGIFHVDVNSYRLGTAKVVENCFISSLVNTPGSGYSFGIATISRPREITELDGAFVFKNNVISHIRGDVGDRYNNISSGFFTDSIGLPIRVNVQDSKFIDCSGTGLAQSFSGDSTIRNNTSDNNRSMNAILTAVVSFGGTGYNIGDTMLIDSGAGAIISISVDGFGSITASTMITPGTNYAAGETWYIDGGTNGIILVDAVNGVGGITAYTILNPGINYQVGNTTLIVNNKVYPYNLDGGGVGGILRVDDVSITGEVIKVGFKARGTGYLSGPRSATALQGGGSGAKFILNTGTIGIGFLDMGDIGEPYPLANLGNKQTFSLWESNRAFNNGSGQRHVGTIDANYVTYVDVTPLPANPAKPIPLIRSEINTGTTQVTDPAQLLPTHNVSTIPNGPAAPPLVLASRQPAQIASRQPAQIASRQPAQIASRQPAQIASREIVPFGSRNPAKNASYNPVSHASFASGGLGSFNSFAQFGKPIDPKTIELPKEFKALRESMMKK
jgi:hypothetical protein